MKRDSIPCRHCCEPISPNANICKHCDNEQRTFLFWLSQLGTPVGLFATVISVAISTAAFIKAGSGIEPKPDVSIVSLRVTTNEKLELDLYNFGDAPARISSLSLSRKFEYGISGYDKYKVSLVAEPAKTLMPGKAITVGFNLEEFGIRANWRGNLWNWSLPQNIRKGPIRQLNVSSISCDLVFLSEFGSSFFELDGAKSGLCHAIEGHVVNFFSENPRLVHHAPYSGK